VDTRRKHQVAVSPPMPGIPRVTSLKVLGVPSSMICQRPIMSVESSLTARRLLLFTCSAWWGFSNATDRQRINAFFQRSICCCYCPPDLPPFEELCQAGNQQFFFKILPNSGYLLHINIFLCLLQRRRTITFVSVHTIGN